MQSLTPNAPAFEEYRIVGEEEECLFRHPVFLIVFWGAGVEGAPQPQPEWSSGFCSPCESPRPVPVTEDAAIYPPKKWGILAPDPPPCNIIYYVAGIK